MVGSLRSAILLYVFSSRAERVDRMGAIAHDIRMTIVRTYGGGATSARALAPRPRARRKRLALGPRTLMLTPSASVVPLAE